MDYRKLPHGDERISVIGLGTSSMGSSSVEEQAKTFRKAFDAGINYIDLASGFGSTFGALGKAMEGRREKTYLQIHFGANYETGEYGWTTDLNKVKEAVDWMLEQLQTDYIDFGFLHCLDEEADLNKVKENGILDYILELKEKGIIRHIGLSTHNPDLANKVFDLDILDMMMFSINPAYDYHHGSYAIGNTDERMKLYQRAEKEGVAISVMKPFSGGQLLDAEKSLFGKAMTRAQLIQYALDKPAVITVLPGIRNEQDLDEILDAAAASDEEKDYSIISEFPELEHEPVCVYCRHCHPCPAGLDIALINKYYDLARLGDHLAEDHYHHLEKKASDCLQCGHCNHRCPFHVEQMARMKEIEEYFGE